MPGEESVREEMMASGGRQDPQLGGHGTCVGLSFPPD